MHKKILLLLLIITNLSYAEEIKLSINEIITVTASRLPLAISNIGKIITIITQNEIKQSKANSIQELLNYIGSLDIQERSKNGIQADFSIRGSTFQQVLILIDGIRFNDLQTAHHNSDIPIPLDSIEYIEILHGGGSSIHGADAFGGVINIVTKKNANNKMNSSFSYGQFNSYNAALSSYTNINKLAFISSIQVNSSDGFTYDRDYKTLTLSNKLSGKLLSGNISINTAYSSKNFGAFDFYTPGKNFPSFEKTKTLLFSYIYSKKITDNINFLHSISFRHHYDDFLLDKEKPFLFNNKTTNNILNSHFIISNNHIAVGLEFAKEHIDSIKLGQHSAKRFSVFSEYGRLIFAKLMLNIGIRLDWHQIYDWSYSPSLCSTYFLSENINIKFNISRAFRAPSYTELFYEDPVNEGNSYLEPETAWIYELALDSKISNKVNMLFSAFKREENNLIDWIKYSFDNKWYAENIKDMNIKGLETIIKSRMMNNKLSFALSATLISAKQNMHTVEYKYGFRFPKLHVATTINYQFNKLLSTNIKATYKDRINQKNYFLTDISFNFNIKQSVIFIKGNNIFNKQYEDVTGVSMPGRWLFIGIEFFLK